MKFHYDRVFRVLLALDLSSEAGRQKLRGVYRFLSEGRAWDLSLVRSPEEFGLRNLRAAGESAYDGFIISLAETAKMKERHVALQTPTVFISRPDPLLLRELPLSVFVNDDDREIVETAAQHLLQQGATGSYVYAEASTNRAWSRVRGDWFARILSRRKIPLTRIADTDRLSREAIARRLEALQPPICVLAAYDDTAARVIESCRLAKLAVPGNVSVLGIGNDELICSHAVPPLSSVIPDFEAEGYRSARELQAMMLRARRPVRREITCGCKGVAQRGSTRGGNSAALLVQEGLAYIRAHALDGITAADVVRALNVSRRLADLRFRELTDRSILEHILGLRLAEVCRQLEKTDSSIADIARSCHCDAASLKNLFRRHFGMSMRDWRKLHSRLLTSPQARTGTSCSACNRRRTSSPRPCSPA